MRFSSWKPQFTLPIKVKLEEITFIRPNCFTNALVKMNFCYSGTVLIFPFRSAFLYPIKRRNLKAAFRLKLLYSNSLSMNTFPICFAVFQTDGLYRYFAFIVMVNFDFLHILCSFLKAYWNPGYKDEYFVIEGTVFNWLLYLVTCLSKSFFVNNFGPPQCKIMSIIDNLELVITHFCQQWADYFLRFLIHRFCVFVF